MAQAVQRGFPTRTKEIEVGPDDLPVLSGRLQPFAVEIQIYAECHPRYSMSVVLGAFVQDGAIATVMLLRYWLSFGDPSPISRTV